MGTAFSVIRSRSGKFFSEQRNFPICSAKQYHPVLISDTDIHHADRNALFSEHTDESGSLRQHRTIRGSRLDRTTFCIFSAKLHKSPWQ